MPEIQLKGRKLAYGVEPPDLDTSSLSVVFVHGSGGDREDWRAQLEGLSGVANVVAVELPGHGASDPSNGSSVGAHAGCVADLVEALGLKKVMVVGCSLGSAVTLWLALNPKPWLVAIGLVGAGARLRVHPQFLEGILKDRDTAVDALTDFCLSPATGEVIRAGLREKYAKVAPEVIHSDLSACNDFDVMDRLGEIKLPSWIIVGQDDKLTPVKYSKFLSDAIKGSRMEIVPDAGHLVMMEKPEEFNRSLREFLAETAL